MIEITKNISIKHSEIKFTFIASPGPGGQNVNKLATAVQLRFDVLHSPSITADVRARLLRTLGKKITNKGELLIKATRYRTQESNKRDALDRLRHLIKRAAITPKKRKKTKPTLASKERHLATKKLHSAKKALRRDV